MAVSRPRVYCRIRPLNEKELAVEGPKECFTSSSTEPNTLLYSKEKDGDQMKSRFDAVLGPETTQPAVFDLLKEEVLSSLFSGYNATIFAYGQTGSGKTYTMEGHRGAGQDTRGLIPRLISALFERFESNPDIENASVKLSFVQIYQDQVQDLLMNRKLLEIRLDKAGHYVAAGATWRDIKSEKEAMQTFHEASKNRATNATEMNLVSSRSHALLQLQLQWDEPLAPGSNAKLNLVDLAGSEKVALSGATGETLKEAIAINKSLSALSNVVKALVDQARDTGKRIHVPYKDSKLTYLLQSSLGGNNLVHFILCLSASVLYRNEGQSTVEFGKRALKVVLRPVKNPIDYKRLEEMERMIEKMRKHISELEGKLSQKESEMRRAPPTEGAFLNMETIRQEADEATPATEFLNSKQREDMQQTLSEMQAHKATIENQLARKEAELANLQGSSAKEREAMQQLLDEEKQRYSVELATLQSNIDRQAAMMREKEDEFRKATAGRKQRSMRKLNKAASVQAKKMNQELERIFKTLPESLHELTSHCILFPESKERFRELGGLRKLLALIDSKGNKGRESYIAHAAYALSIAVDEKGRDEVREMGGMECISEVLKRDDEHSKQFACRALEALARGSPTNRQQISLEVLSLLTKIVDHPHQQVKEAACSALAEIADGQPEIKSTLRNNGLLGKLVALIRESPPEVTELIKVGVSVLGRLAQQDADCQKEIAKLGGVELLTNILFSPVGDRDPQIPVLTSYALVNLCCNNRNNMASLVNHPNYNDIRFKLLEGLGRVFVDNIASENRERVTATHTITDGNTTLFSYHGVTSQGEWGPFTAGGRPTYSTFLENPQYVLQVPHDSNISIVLSDVNCEARIHQRTTKKKTIYMGIAVFRGDRLLLCDRGLKQLDFNGRFVTSGRYNRNRENTLSLTLPQSPDPYLIIPFTAHACQYTRFALSVFSDEPVVLTHLPEEGGWMKRVYEGKWTQLTGRGVERFDWRNNDQYIITVSEPTTLVVVLSYKKLDEFRFRQSIAPDDDELGDDDERNEEKRERPHLHGRIFLSEFAKDRRYIRSNIPSPQNASFVSCNEYLSTSCVKTTAQLKPGETYVYIPATQSPVVDDYRVAFFSDVGDVSISPLRSYMEWYAFTFKGTWATSPRPVLYITGSGKVSAFGISEDVYVMLTVHEILDRNWVQGHSKYSSATKTVKVFGTDAFWAHECVLEADLPCNDDGTPKSYVVMLQGIVSGGSGEQKPADSGDFFFALFASDIGVRCSSELEEATEYEMATRLNCGPDKVDYGMEANMATAGYSDEGDMFSSGSSDDDSVKNETLRENEQLRDELESTRRALELTTSSANEEVATLKAQLEEKQTIIETLQSNPIPPQPPRQGSSALIRRSSSAQSLRKGQKPSAKTSKAVGGGGASAAKALKDNGQSDDKAARMQMEVASLKRVVEEAAAASTRLSEKVQSLVSLNEVPTLLEFRQFQHELKQATASLLAAVNQG